MANAEALSQAITVEVVISPGPGLLESVTLTLPAGSTVGDALQRSGIAGPQADDRLLGIWGKRCTRTKLLRDGDRVEIYRALLIDAMQARRARQRAQGTNKLSGNRR